MNQLHPISQQAISPFLVAPQVSHDNEVFAAAQKAPFVQSVATKRMRKSTQTFWYCLSGVDLECELDYQGSTGDGWNEPRESECADLCEAFVGGVDIYALLDDDQKAQIETAFLETDRSDD